uniref:Uncharacterized protein n=1 Tax=Arundo donax TaxID=35708 RepID=A0A0A9DRG3_ARUDO
MLQTPCPILRHDPGVIVDLEHRPDRHLGRDQDLRRCSCAGLSPTLALALTSPRPLCSVLAVSANQHSLLPSCYVRCLPSLSSSCCIFPFPILSCVVVAG